MSIEHILECVRKTNPGMARGKLLEELSKCRYSAVVLRMVCESNKESACGEWVSIVLCGNAEWLNFALKLI